jgi:hypothetical protein
MFHNANEIILAWMIGIALLEELSGSLGWIDGSEGEIWGTQISLENIAILGFMG